MAIGDNAQAAGFPIVPETGEEGRARWGAREINRTRDFVAQVKALLPVGKAAYRAASGITYGTGDPGAGTDGDIYYKVSSSTVVGYIYEGTSWRSLESSGGDHTGLTNLDADDHPQYLRVDSGAYLPSDTQIWVSASEMDVANGAPVLTSARFPVWSMPHENPIVGTTVPVDRMVGWSTFAVDLYHANPSATAGTVEWRMRRGFAQAGTDLTSAAVFAGSAAVSASTAPQNELQVTTLETGVSIPAGSLLYHCAPWRSFVSGGFADDQWVVGVMLRKVS